MSFFALSTFYFLLVCFGLFAFCGYEKKARNKCGLFWKGVWFARN